MGQEAEQAQAVVGVHDDDAARGEVRPVVDGHVAAARREGAAVDPEEHGQPLRGARRRRPYVEVQAVLADRAADQVLLRPGAEAVAGRPVLLAVGAERVGLADAAPREGGLRRAPAIRPDRRRRVRHAEVGHDASPGRARERALVDARLEHLRRRQSGQPETAATTPLLSNAFIGPLLAVPLGPRRSPRSLAGQRRVAGGAEPAGAPALPAGNSSNLIDVQATQVPVREVHSPGTAVALARTRAAPAGSAPCRRKPPRRARRARARCGRRRPHLVPGWSGSPPAEAATVRATRPSPGHRPAVGQSRRERLLDAR